jgi:hypothetical protein
LKGRNEKAVCETPVNEFDWEKMSGMQWHRLSFSCAAGATGAQNLSTAVQ